MYTWLAISHICSLGAYIEFGWSRHRRLRCLRCCGWDCGVWLWWHATGATFCNLAFDATIHNQRLEGVQA